MDHIVIDPAVTIEMREYAEQGVTARVDETLFSACRGSLMWTYAAAQGVSEDQTPDDPEFHAIVEVTQHRLSLSDENQKDELSDKPGR
jgi:hypothetical protein